MSLLLQNSLDDAAALIRGELAAPNTSRGFPVVGLGVWRLLGISPAVGTAVCDTDLAWQQIVRGWWALGLTWGIYVHGDGGRIHWSLLLPESYPSAVGGMSAHLQGAAIESAGPFEECLRSLNQFSHKAAMGGHPSVGAHARLDSALRAMVEKPFAALVVSRAVTNAGIANEIARWETESQFVRDEHLARPGLERDNHSRAASYLQLVQAGLERATAAIQDGAWETRTLFAASSSADFEQLQSMVHASYASEGGRPEPIRWQAIDDPRSLTFHCTGEVAALSRPPRVELPGFVLEGSVGARGERSEIPAALFATTAQSTAIEQPVCLGQIIRDDGSAGEWLEIGRNDLCRHMLVAGMTGSGKTTTCEHLVLELWREHRVPWLVIEPGMKASYRRLLNSEIGSDMAVWAVGNPLAPRLSMNPLAAPAGIGLSEHISGLFAVLASAYDLVAPMPEVLATAIEQTYRNHGWNPAGLVPGGPPPRLTDLVEEIEHTTARLGYGAEVTGNIRAGLLLRLRRLTTGPLAPELTSASPLPVERLVARPTVIELSALPDSETQALVLGFITLQLRHHWRLAGPSASLRHVTLIEEAHRLLRAVPETTANSVRARSVEDLANMLAELRGMGAGLVIVDQTPAALVPSVIANTGTKILHRLDHPDDREKAGRSAGLPADRVDLLGALRVGEAILRTDQRARPLRVRVPNPAVTYGALPLPKLPIGSAPPVAQAPANQCSICGASRCVANQEGSAPNKIATRLRTLQAALGEGESAVWNWSIHELASTGHEQTTKSAPLCFLIAVAERAKLSDSAVRRLRSAFANRINPA